VYKLRTLKISLQLEIGKSRLCGRCPGKIYRIKIDLMIFVGAMEFVHLSNSSSVQAGEETGVLMG
jgi:predicted metal-binding protein